MDFKKSQMLYGFGRRLLIHSNDVCHVIIWLGHEVNYVGHVISDVCHEVNDAGHVTNDVSCDQ